MDCVGVLRPSLLVSNSPFCTDYHRNIRDPRIKTVLRTSKCGVRFDTNDECRAAPRIFLYSQKNLDPSGMFSF